MKNKHRRGKRKSRTELYKARATKAYVFVTRIPQLVRGGNPFGLSEYTMVAARGPERAA